MVRIFCVEDDENIRELIIYALKSSGFEAIGFEEGRSFFKEISKEAPELVLLDIMLPDIDGIDILKKLKESASTADIPVIILTAKSSEFDKVKGLDLGADDNITKPYSVMELISRVKAVLRRTGGGNEEDIINLQDISINYKKRSLQVKGEAVALTYKEFELLYYLMQNKEIVLSREQLMERVWGFDFEGETRTVDMHIKTLRQKLGSSGSLIESV